MTNHESHDTSRDRLRSSDSQSVPPLPEDEISILDCEFEIIHSETDPDHSSLVNNINQSEANEIRSQSDISEPVPDLESVKSIPRVVSNSVLDELETKSTTSSINGPHNDNRTVPDHSGSPNRSVRGRPPKRSTEFKFGSTSYFATFIKSFLGSFYIGFWTKTCGPRRLDQKLCRTKNQEKKKKISEDIPNTLKVPEKRISRSGRTCREVIPFTIENQRYYNIKKARNSTKMIKTGITRVNSVDNELDNEFSKVPRNRFQTLCGVFRTQGVRC